MQKLRMWILLVCGGLGACAPASPTADPSTAQPATAIAARSSPAVAQPSAPENTVITVQRMQSVRAAHTSTLLSNGNVMIAGGFASNEQATASAEVFDALTRTFAPASSMLVARQSHTATLLPDGKVLMAGGFGTDYLASAELYDPLTGQFSPTGSMTMARSGHIAVLLATGKVLIAGGVGKDWSFLASAELYDPQTGSFTSTGSMLAPRESHTATRLNNGQVLVTGGHQGRRTAITIYASAELYDPASGTWMATGDMIIRRHKHDATLLLDGRVFISGGSDERDSDGAYTSTEIYEPATGIFTAAASMHASRYKHTGTSLLLADGAVLLIGGAATPELYHPSTNTVASVSGLDATRLFATATLLHDASVLFAGGYGTNIAADNRAWIFHP